MRFAINYSPAAAGLVQSGQIEVDYFKTPPWPDMIAEAAAIRPVTVHFELRTGAGLLPERDWGDVQAFLSQTGTRYVNLHLTARVEDYPGVLPEQQTAHLTDQIVERLVSEVRAVAAHFGPERVIFENVPYRGNRDRVLRASVLPETLRRVAGETGCGLLLDISHARIAARHLGIDEGEYIASLPVESLRELHFTGLHTLEGGFLMDHLPVLEADWPWLSWGVENIQAGRWGQPDLLAFEYGGVGKFFKDHTDPQVIAGQVPRLVALCRAAVPGAG
jgi:uncharacterized protein (UPF0276 family)